MVELFKRVLTPKHVRGIHRCLLVADAQQEAPRGGALLVNDRLQGQAVMLPKIIPLRKTWPGGGPQYPPPHPTRIQEIVLWKPAGRATISTAAAPLHAIVATWNPVLQNLSPEELLCIGAVCLKQGAPKPNARLVHPGAKLGPRRNRLSQTCFQGPSAEAVM